MKTITTIFSVILLQLILFFGLSMTESSTVAPKQETSLPTVKVERRSFPVNIKTVGELEAASSICVFCPIRTEQATIIEVIPDGTHVNVGDSLVKFDPTPFEKRIEELKVKLIENEALVLSLQQALDWETTQVAHEKKTIRLEKETAEMELNKILKGDAPLEIARLKALMKKAESKYQEINGYAKDLEDLEKEGFILASEVEQTKRKIEEELENFDNAKLQYEAFVEHVYPMQIRKAEAVIEKVKNQIDEVERTGKYKITKAEGLLKQAKQQLEEIQLQIYYVRQELNSTELKATTPGMVVLKEDFRTGQKRKPRIGDVLVRNQAILDLPDLSSMVVKTKVRELDLHKIDLQKNATVEVDAYPHLRLQAKVNFIGILAMADQGRQAEEKNFEVKLLIDQSDQRLRPGMTARIVIHADEVVDGLTIPIHAVFEMDKKYYCYVAKNGYYLKNELVLGKSDEHFVEIYDGVNVGDEVCLCKPEDDFIVVH